jgi:hypothetical protein
MPSPAIFRGLSVSDTDQARKSRLEKAATLSLKEGLRSCRAVISGYRALLSGSDPDVSHEEEANSQEQ